MAAQATVAKGYGQRGDKCPECRQWVNGPCMVAMTPGHLMSQVHKLYRNAWHLHCWAEAERQAAESRARAEEQRVADLFAMGRELGWTDEQTQALLDKRAAEAEL